MARCRFVQPDVVRISLSDGDWIEIKRELTAAESRRVFSGTLKDFSPGGKPLIDPEKVGRTQISEYLVDWSFCDATGKRQPVTASAIDALDIDSYNEIREAIDAHIITEDTRRESEKNGRGGESKSAAISPSVV